MDVVWLHGFPLGPESWDAQLAAFGGIAPGLVAEDAHTLDAMADRALAAADDAGLQRLHLVGLSMGGYVAMRLLERVPHRVESVILADTRAEPDTVEGKAARDRMIEALARDGPEAATGFLRKELADRSPDLLRSALAQAHRHTPTALAAALRAMRDRPDARPSLARAKRPVLVVVGERDSLVSVESARGLARSVPGARLEVIPGVGHFSNLEAPAEFNRVAGAFLRAPAAPRP